MSSTWRLVLNRTVLENMKKNPDNRSRLFSKKSYGYIKTSEKSEIEGFYPNDSGIDVSEFLISGKPDSKIQNAFNVEQPGLGERQPAQLHKPVKVNPRLYR